MRQSEVELDRLARQDSLTGLANREVLRRALDDALVGAVAAEAPLLGVPARPRPVQGRQRHPGAPRGGHFASSGVAAAARGGRRDGPGRPPRRRRVRGRVAAKPRPRPTSRRLAQGIIDSLSRPYTINGTVVSIGASIGIVTSDYDDRTSDDLMRDADLGALRRQGGRKGLLPLLRAGDARSGARTAADGIGPSGRARERPAAGRLPAAGRCFE